MTIIHSHAQLKSVPDVCAMVAAVAARVMEAERRGGEDVGERGQ